MEYLKDEILALFEQYESGYFSESVLIDKLKSLVMKAGMQEEILKLNALLQSGEE